jgi:lysophospholipase L1-like esterase
MKDAFKLIPNFIRKMSYLFIVTVFSILSLNSSVYADVGQDLTYPFYSAKSACTQNSSPSNLKSGDSVYILGDSISVYTEASYRSELAKSGLQPTINGSTGRSWIGGGSYTPTTGGSLKPAKEAVQDDKASIQGAKAIVIALGSNGGLNGNPIGEMIDTIREINPNSPIFWVNLAGTSKWTGVNLSYMGPFNQALTTESTAKNFRIIDWFSQVNPGGNPDSQPTIDKEGVLEDGLHPNTSGVQKLSTLVASSLGSSTAPTENLNTGNCQCSVGGSGPVELIGNDNTEKAFRYFLGKGLSPEQAAGILGNMTIESGVDPENIQDPGGRSQNPNDAGSAGWGLIQWTPGSKVINIAKNANINTPIYELGTQLEVVWWHMNNTSPTGVKNFIEKFKQTTTVEEATADFEDRMEGAGVTAIPRRVKFAQDILASYGGSAPNQSGGGASSASCPTGGWSRSEYR